MSKRPHAYAPSAVTVLFTAALSAVAHAAGEVRHVATLWSTTSTTAAPYVKALEEGLTERGWAIGKTLRLQHHYTDGRPEGLQQLSLQIVTAKPDAIWASLNTAAFALRQHTTTIPIIVGSALDPVGTGLVASMARPGGNITGLGAAQIETHAKRLEILREVLPNVRTVAVIYNPDYPGNDTAVKSIASAARSHGLDVIDGQLRNSAEAKSTVSDVISRGADAILGVADNLTFLHRGEIAAMAREARLPTVFPLREFCDTGVLICYSGNLRAIFKRSAAYLDRVLRGANPADLPMEQVSTFEFVVNMRTAQALGITLPESLLVRADHVIE